MRAAEIERMTRDYRSIFELETPQRVTAPRSRCACLQGCCPPAPRGLQKNQIYLGPFLPLAVKDVKTAFWESKTDFGIEDTHWILHPLFGTEGFLFQFLNAGSAF
jgi:hypothetical protein